METKDKIPTGYTDKDNYPVFIGDRVYSDKYQQWFIVGQTILPTQRPIWVKSENGRYDLGITAVKDMRVKPDNNLFSVETRLPEPLVDLDGDWYEGE